MKNKRFLAVILAVLTSHTMMNGTVMGKAEPAYVPEIKYFNDFAVDKTYFAGATGYTSLEDSGEEMSGQALAINPVKDLSYINVNTPMKDGKDFSMSFDFKAQQEDHPLQMFTQETVESVNVRIAAMNYDVKGNLVIKKKAKHFEETTGSYSSDFVATYVGTEWTNITMHFHPDGYNTTIDWYINGKFIVTSTASGAPEGKNFSGGMDSFHFGTTQSGVGMSNTSVVYDGDEQFLIDNFKIEYIDSEYTYSTLKTQVGMETSELEIVFSEPINTEITPENISVTNTETGEKVDVLEVKGSANKMGRMNIVVDGDFIADTEYSIDLPENIKGASGRKLFSNKIYFVPVGVLDLECPTITENILKTTGNCEDLPEGTLESLGKEKGNWTKYLVCDWVHDISAENTGTEEEPNMAISFAPDHTSTQFLRLETEGGENSPFIPDTDKTTIVWSMDVMRKELKRTYPLMFIMGKDKIGSVGVGYFFFDSYGNFVFLNGSGDWWSTEDKDVANGAEYSAKQTAYQAGIKAGEWVNVTAVIDSKSETVTYFVDKEYAGMANWPSNRKGQGYNYYSGMRINPEEMYRDGRKVYFDNYKLGYANVESNKKVTSFRLHDRLLNSYAPGENNVTTDIRSLNISFNEKVGDISAAEITLMDADEKTVGISNIKASGEKITADVVGILKKDTQYTIVIKGIKTKEDEEFKTYTNSFKTTAEGEFVITEFELKDSSGNRISDVSQIAEGESVILNVSAINTTDKDVYLNASLTSYNNSVLSNDETVKIKVNANSKNSDANTKITVSDIEDLYIVATLTDEDKKPLENAIELGRMTVSKDSWSLSFEDKTTQDSKIYAEIQAPEDSADSIVFRGQVTSDEDGIFKVFVKLFDDPEVENDAKSGEYILSWVDESGNKGTKSLNFANVNRTYKTINDINEAIKEGKESAINSISQILSSEDNRYALGMFDGVQNDELKIASEIIYNYAEETALADENASIIVNKAGTISGIVSGRIDNLFDREKTLELDSSRISEFYTKSYVNEKMEKEITAKISTAEISDFSDFYDILEESFVLVAVKNPDGEENLRKIMNEFSEEIGIVKNGNDKAYRAVMYNSYNSYEALKAAFNSANAVVIQNGGGNSSGSYGGSSNKSSTSVVGGYVNKNDVQDVQIPYSIFSDIDHVAWAKDAIVRLAEMQIISGKGDNKFYPDDNVTRAEFTKMVVVAFEYKNQNDAESAFSDVPQWAKEYVDIAYENGIVSGYSVDIFGSNDKITRQDLVTMAYRAATAAGEEYDTQGSNMFSDSTLIADYAKEAVHTLFNAGMINGVGNGEFAPTAFATRAEAAKIIHNMIMN